MLIYTTMRNVQGEDKDRLLVSIWVSASHPEGDRSTAPPPVGLHETAHTNRTEEMSYMGLQCEIVDDGRVFLKRRAEESHMFIVTIEKGRWYIPRWWTAKVGVPLNVGSRGGGGWGV